MVNIQSRFKDALLVLNRIECRSIINEYNELHGGFAGVDGIIVPALTSIGDDWEKGVLALSQVYMSGRICEELLNDLNIDTSIEKISELRIASTVYEDYHLLGKRILDSLLKSSGYAAIDWGYGTTQSEIISRLEAEPVDVLLISTLMLNSAIHIKTLTAQIKELKIPVKIAVGGAPFRLDPELWKYVGADYFGYSAHDVLAILEQIEGGLS